MKKTCTLLIRLVNYTLIPYFILFSNVTGQEAKYLNFFPESSVRFANQYLINNEYLSKSYFNPFCNESIKNSINHPFYDSVNSKVITYFYEPYPQEIGSSIFQIGGSFSLMPIQVAEQEFAYPALDIQFKHGLFENISFVASLSTTYIYANLLHTGLQWNMSSGRFSFGIANHFGCVLGFMPEDELFDKVSAYGLFDMPIVRFGYRFDDFSVSLSFVVTYGFKAVSYVNEKLAPVGPENALNDFFCSIVVEQPFLKNAHVSVGVSIAYAKTPYQSWMLHNTLKEWLFVPEFFFAVQL